MNQHEKAFLYIVTITLLGLLIQAIRMLSSTVPNSTF